MSRALGKQLNAELFARLGGEEANTRAGKAIVVVTVDEAGWSHPAMLSYYEVVAKDRDRIDLAIGKTSTTAKNLRRTGKITFIVTDNGLNYYLKGIARELPQEIAGIPFMALFRAKLEQVLEDQEPGATITSGITFSRVEKPELTRVVEKIYDGVRSAL